MMATAAPEQKTKHTPGPWIADMRHGSGNPVVTTENGWWIAETCGPIDNRAEREANAYLIAAALEMLAALKLFTSASMSESRPTRGESFIGWQKGDGLTASERVAIARTAVAKAEGRA